MNLQEEVLKYKDDTVKSMQGILKIKSVRDEAKPNMPFGEGVVKSLEYFLDLAKSMGFETTNFDNYVGQVDFGDGAETLGILGHLDVVPEGDNWEQPPYEAKIADGKLYARGVLDDKGPMVACLYAMKALKDAGVVPKKKIRMIVGTNEETGWGGMKYYFDELKMPQPDIAFTPDAEFPVIFAEKGIVPIIITKKFDDIADICIKGGNAINSVCESVVAKLPAKYAGEIEAKLKEFNKGKEYKITSKVEGNSVVITSLGKSAHGSKPFLGYNSVNALMLMLKDINIEEKGLKDIINLFDTRFKMTTDGKLIGIHFEDEYSGESTTNVGYITLENGQFTMGVDCRHPVTVDTNVPIDIITKDMAKLGYTCKAGTVQAPLYVPKDDFLVQTLMNIYKDVTGDTKAEPLFSGGGTYARAVKKGVAFGALLKDQEDNMHQRNEYLELDKLDIWLKIYVEAIYQLTK